MWTLKYNIFILISSLNFFLRHCKPRADFRLPETVPSTYQARLEHSWRHPKTWSVSTCEVPCWDLPAPSELATKYRNFSGICAGEIPTDKSQQFLFFFHSFYNWIIYMQILGLKVTGRSTDGKKIKRKEPTMNISFHDWIVRSKFGAIPVFRSEKKRANCNFQSSSNTTGQGTIKFF